MKYRVKVISLAAMFIVLTLLYVSGLTFGRGRVRSDSDTPAVSGGLEPEDITRLEITTAEDSTYRLTRTDEGRWIVSEGPEHTPCPGDPGRIEPFLENILTAARKSMVTGDREKYGQFEVEQGSRPRIELGSDSGSVILYIGKADSGGMGEYARVDGEDQVFLTSRLSSYVNRDVTYWADLSILPDTVTEKNVVSLSCSVRADLDTEGEETSWSLMKSGEGDDSWIETATDRSPDPIAVERIIRNLVHLKAKGFAGGVSGNTRSEGTVVAAFDIRTAAGENYAVRARPRENGEECVVSVSGKDVLFEMDRSVLLRVCGAPEELFP